MRRRMPLFVIFIKPIKLPGRFKKPLRNLAVLMLLICFLSMNVAPANACTPAITAGVSGGAMTIAAIPAAPVIVVAAVVIAGGAAAVYYLDGKDSKKENSPIPDNVVKPGTAEWNKEVKRIKDGKGKGINSRVETQEQAEELLEESMGDIPSKETYTRESYKTGYEVHPVNSREKLVGNNLPHIKYKDWSHGKSGKEGHIFWGR